MVAVWLWEPDAIRQLTSQSYLPHGFCYLWNPRLLTLHVVSDTIIFFSYLAISGMLAWLLYAERRRIPLAWVFVAFGLFIVACAFTHAMDVVVLWKPYYWLQGDVKLITAIASLTTAAALPFYLPKVRQLLEAARSSRSNEVRFLAASHSSNDAFYIFESVRGGAGEIVDFRFVFVNANGARLLSCTPEELTGTLLCVRLPSYRRDGFFERFQRVAETGEPLVEEFAVHEEHIDAEWLSHQVVKLNDGIAVTTTNISARKRDEIKLANLAQFTQSIFASSPLPTIVTDCGGLIVSVNPAAERALWYAKEELIGQTALVLLEPQAVARRAGALSQELGATVESNIEVLTARPRRGLVEDAEWKVLRKDGSSFEAQLTISGLNGENGEISGLILIGYDITERKRAQEYIAHLAHHDALTGLPTRTLLHDRMGVSISRAIRSRKKVALLMIDLDQFKKVNDLLGHHVGDELLVQVAKRLQAGVRLSDTVARMGGDEFVVLLSDLSSRDEAEAIAEKLRGGLQFPVAIGTQTIHVTASIGLCLYPDNGESGETLLQNADAAMYRVKSDGRNAVQSFTLEMASASSRKRELEANLHHALAQKELELVWQPQVSLADGRITGAEALLRWRSGRLGNVAPNEFIPVAEESGLIVPIGEWVLRTACREGRELQERLGRPILIAVNISPRQFQQETLPSMIAETLAEVGMAANTLELEITENILVSDSPRPMAILEQVRALGVRVAIDDFGTGFSSMSYILRFRVDRLKIDRSFVRNMIADPDSRAVTTAVTALASGLNINVVAEGVETASHRDLLQQIGCDEAQGYLYSRPVRIEEVAALIHELEHGAAGGKMEAAAGTLEQRANGHHAAGLESH
jgi:diguanylate cyclase (GGDEF)-like protein/PAS domain S-box-containing protein